MKLASLTWLAFASLSNAQTTADLTIAPVSGSSTRGVLRFRDGTGVSAQSITIRVPALGVTTGYSLDLPRVQAPGGGAFLFNDGTGILSWQTVTGGGGGGPVTAVTASTPLTSTGGATPDIACATCMRIDANNIPTGLYDLGESANPWSNIYGVVYRASDSIVCADSAYMQGSVAFGGTIFTKNSSCVVQAQMNGNGFDTVNSLGSYRVQGNVVIDPSRNATVNNLTILGSCTGCPSGGGGGISGVTATYPVLSSGGSLPNISCPTCFDLTTNKINVPGFNVEVGTAANWIYRQYTQSYYSPNGFSSDAAAMTSTALFGGQIYTKNGSGGSIQAQMSGTGFDTVGSIGNYKVQGTTVIDSLRGASFTSVASTGAVSASGFIASGSGGQTITATVRDSAGTGTCTLTFTGGILTGKTGFC